MSALTVVLKSAPANPLVPAQYDSVHKIVNANDLKAIIPVESD